MVALRSTLPAFVHTWSSKDEPGRSPLASLPRRMVALN